MTSFSPIVGPTPRVLILGSMPGVRSLRAGEYYAHPRNAFWGILEDLGTIPSGLGYCERTAAMAEAGIALWDVLRSCCRAGSLDASIVADSEEPNDIAGLLGAHPTIRAVLFNGAKAERAFRRYIEPGLPSDVRRRITLLRLPSTSPAHAVSAAVKRAAWREVLAPPVREGEEER